MIADEIPEIEILQDTRRGAGPLRRGSGRFLIVNLHTQSIIAGSRSAHIEPALSEDK
jgi:hypothetical protein